MSKRHSKTANIALIGIGASLALLLSYVEHLLPPLYAAVPGIKLGLPNVIVLYMLYTTDTRSAALVSGVRLLLSTILFGNGNLMAFLYSLAGAVLSFLVMALLKKSGTFSEVGVSVSGAVCHNIGQTLMAILLLQTTQLGYYMVVLAITGTIAGIFIGLCGAQMVKRLPFQKMLKK